VLKAKQYITDGDCMQVVLSQRMSIPFNAAPLDLYRALRCLNPSPYMYYLNLEDFHIVGSSPEILVRLEDNEVTVRPIAGTRRRGETHEQDLDLEKELLADPKEIAEHLMLIDLGRNDTGRVAKIGSVKLTDKMIIERYSHVMHIVSNVTGELQGQERLRRVGGDLPGRHGQRRAENSGDGDHRRTGTGQARHLFRRGRLHRLVRQPGYRDRDPYRRDQGPNLTHSSRRRHRVRFDPAQRMG
jgi:hypothetical protein